MPLTVHEGDDATFQCEVSPPDAEVTWLRNGAVVTPGPQMEIARSGSSHSLTVRGCRLEDSGTVTARAGSTVTSARLHVRETELLFLRRLQDVRAEEGQDVCLEVETGRVGAAGAVRWLRGGEPLPLDSRLALAQDGHVHRLFIHGVALADQGTYGCESHHDRTLARLSVRRRARAHPQPPAPAPGPRDAPPSPAAALQFLGRRDLQLCGGDGPGRAGSSDRARCVQGGAVA
uniref:Ig-like domain-containing protein n=1 Tax=Marmota marmota marmota TaxID=9994 RepID=A0A8C6A2Z0_MARMA